MKIADIWKRTLAPLRSKLATEARGGLTRMPLEIVPGMPAAPEPCMLFSNAYDPAKHPRDALAQPKIDGVRGIFLQTRILTRQALPLHCALHCLPALVALEEAFGEPMVIDGEYQEPDGFTATLAALKREEGVGTFYVFDAVPYSQWRVNRFTMPLRARLAAIEAAFAKTAHDPFVQFLPAVPCGSPALASWLAEQAWARGQEGLVIKEAASLYTRGRSTAWTKLKRVETHDGVVVDTVIVDGDLNRAVALVRLEGRVHKIAAMPPDVRALMLGDLRDGGAGLTGRMVEIAFKERTETGALREARIVRLRPDKEEGEN